MSKYIINVCILADSTPSQFTGDFLSLNAKFLKNHLDLLDAQSLFQQLFPPSFSHFSYTFDTVDSSITTTSSTHTRAHTRTHTYTHILILLDFSLLDFMMGHQSVLIQTPFVHLLHCPWLFSKRFPLGSSSLGSEFGFTLPHILVTQWPLFTETEEKGTWEGRKQKMERLK